MIKKIVCLMLLYLCFGCSNNIANSNIDDDKNLLNEPKNLYKLAKFNFDQQNFEISRNQFIELKKLFPLSNEAIQSEIMIAFIDYVQMDYDSAILNYNSVINKYPSHKDLDYVYYMIAMSNYEQITNYSLDGMYNDLALSSFQQVINRFPMSKYAKDSRQKIILVKSNKAGKHMDIGRFYLKDRKYTAALNRFKIVVEEYSMTKFSPEALHRMVEIYFHLGMKTEAVNSASVLGYNYPNSKWYRYSYELIKEKDKDDSFLNKLIKPFS